MRLRRHSPSLIVHLPSEQEGGRESGGEDRYAPVALSPAALSETSGFAACANTEIHVRSGWRLASYPGLPLFAVDSGKPGYEARWR